MACFFFFFRPAIYWLFRGRSGKKAKTAASGSFPAVGEGIAVIERSKHDLTNVHHEIFKSISRRKKRPRRDFPVHLFLPAHGCNLRWRLVRQTA